MISKVKASAVVSTAFHSTFLAITCICSMDISCSDNQMVEYFLDLIPLFIRSLSEQFVAILVFIELPFPPKSVSVTRNTGYSHFSGFFELRYVFTAESLL